MVLGCLFSICISGAAGAADAYVLGSGDRLRVTVFNNQDMSGEVEVDAAGKVTLPLIQDVPAAGKTVADLEDVIRKKLTPEYLINPRVSVEVLNYRPFYIIGEVQKPGSYPYVAGMTVVNAIALAGGYTYRAKQDKVMIVRSNDPEKKPHQAERGDVVLPGDVIEVTERFF